jgi:hypothetical protein
MKRIDRNNPRDRNWDIDALDPTEDDPSPAGSVRTDNQEFLERQLGALGFDYDEDEMSLTMRRVNRRRRGYRA